MGSWIYSRIEDHSTFDAGLIGKFENLRVKPSESSFLYTTVKLPPKGDTVIPPKPVGVVDNTNQQPKVVLPKEVVTPKNIVCQLCKKDGNRSLDCFMISKLRDNIQSCPDHFCYIHGSEKN